MRLYFAVALLLGVSFVSAQEINISLGLGRRPAGLTLFDQIEDAGERGAFRQVWDAREPRTQLTLAAGFVEQYPRSVLLREAYELAARAHVATGDLAAALVWARRSLRLMPENPFLLILIADTAMKLGDLDLAVASARDAMAYLEHAQPPSPITPAKWPETRAEMRATALYVQGRVAALRGQYRDAEQSLLASLTLKPDDIEALFTIGVVRMAVGAEDGAARVFAQVARGDGRLAASARESLQTLYARRPAPPGSFEDWVATLKWNPPEPPPPAASPAHAGRYAGSGACRECHETVFESWQSTGMARMLRPYRAADVIGDFSGAQTVGQSARALTDGSRHFIEVRRSDNGEWIRYPVDYLIGSKWQQAYATKLPDARLLVFPIQYSRLHSAWVNYWDTVDAPGSGRADIGQFHRVPEDAVYEQTCAPCHTSQLKLEGVRPLFSLGSSALDEKRPEGGKPPFSRTEGVRPLFSLGSSELDEKRGLTPYATFREGGINCEMCHGPSLDHVERLKDPAKTASRGDAATPVRFRQLRAPQYVAVCAQCHAQSAVHDAQPDGAVNYSETGAPFRTYATELPSNFSRRAFYRDGRYRATTFISEAFARSACFRKGGATCGSCHNPHPSNAASNPKSLKFGEDADAMCVQCHKALGERPAQHTRHAAGTEASRCVSCHMPKIMEAVLFQARSHEIDDIPDAEMTGRFGPTDSPNACLGCHRDRDIAWLRAGLAAFKRGN